MRGNCDTCVYFHSTEYFCQLDDSETNEVNSCPQYEAKKVKPLSEIFSSQKLEEIINQMTQEFQRYIEFHDECIIQYKDEVKNLQDELEKEVQSHVDTASVLSNAIKENMLIKGKLKKIEDAYGNQEMTDEDFVNEVGDILESI